MHSRTSRLITLAALLAVAACAEQRSTEPAAKPSTPTPTTPASRSITPGIVTGPVFPPPGGTAFLRSGDPNTPAGAVWTYSGINTSLFSVLAWIPTDVQLSMDGQPNALPLNTSASSLPDGVAVWSGTSLVQLGGATSTVNLRVTLRAASLDGSPYSLESSTGSGVAGMGLPSAAGVALLVQGPAFRFTLTFEAQHFSVFGGAYAPFLDVYNALMTSANAPPGQAVSSFGGGFYYTLQPCPAGQYYDTTSALCADAPVGTYSAGGLATSATPCAPGTFNQTVAQSACVPAAPGTYVPTVGSTLPSPCQAGSFQPNFGASSCMLAPAGSFVDVAAATSATPCPAGRYSASDGATSCAQVPDGYYSLAGASAAIPCAPGTFQPAVAQSSCLLAPAGSYATGLAATSTSLCAIGYFSTGGAAACTPSPAGSYSDSQGATSAKLCLPGNYTSQPGLGACSQATPGYYVASAGATAETACPAGQYSNTYRATSCVIAPAGTYAVGPAATAATPCPAGSYSAQGGAASCVLAPVGTYVATAGASSAITCPAGTTTIVPGSTACRPMIAQTIAFTSTPPVPAVAGGSYTVTATGGASGNPVSISTSGAGCRSAGNVISFVAAGPCVVTANQAGGGLYFAATAVSQTFTVIPPTPQALVGAVANQVQAFVNSGVLSSIEAGPLTDKLNSAIAAYQRGNGKSGDNQMGAFINQVQAMQRSGRLSEAAAQTLIAGANAVIAAGE